MISKQIQAIKSMMNDALIDLALEAFRKGIKTTLIPSSCHYRGVDSVEMITKTEGDKFDYVDVFANDIESIERGIKFILEHGTKSESVWVVSDSEQIDLIPPHNPYSFMPLADEPEFIDLAEMNGY